MYTKLIVPLDTSGIAELALDPTEALARRLHVPVELVIVSSPGMDVTEDRCYLDKLAAGLQCDVGELRTAQSNDVASVLVDLADDPGALLCMSTRGQGRLAAMLGSVATAVVRHARHPVLLFGPAARAATTFDTVMACIEPGSDRSHAALAPAVAMSMALDATLWLVEVGQRTWVVRDMDGTVDGGEVATIAHGLRHVGIGVEWEVRHDDRAATGILLEAEALHPAVIVAASRARTGVARLALGSVAMEVVHGAPCGVLVVPPSSSADGST